MRSWLLGLVLAGCTDPPVQQPAPAPAPPAAPDIVLVVVDTLRADHLGLYGYARPTSPHIDAWARDGLTYERAYAHSGWTLASFASLLTGQLPHEHRVGRHPTDPRCFGRLPPEAVTLPERLKAQGYATAAFVNNTFLAPEFGLQQGFDLWDWKGSDPKRHRSADETVQRALAWMQGQAGPRFVMVHMMEPHTVYNPPPQVKGTFSAATPVPPGQEIDADLFVRWQTYETLPTPEQKARAIALYDEEILTVDLAFGALVEGLKKQASPGGTLVVLTSDHGEELWDHGGFEHGHSLLGELTHVPLVLVGPGQEAGRSATVVDHRDLYRTLLGVAGVADPGGPSLSELSAQGPGAAPRQSISENTLYGPPRVSIVDPEHRLDLRQDSRAASLWAVEEGGRERQLLGIDLDRTSRPLHAALLQARGNLDPIVAIAGAEDGCGAKVEDYQTFQMLEALGYLDQRPSVPIDQAAPQPAGEANPGR